MKPGSCVSFAKPISTELGNFHFPACFFKKKNKVFLRTKRHLMPLGLGTSVSYSWPFLGKLPSLRPKKKMQYKILNRKKCNNLEIPLPLPSPFFCCSSLHFTSFLATIRDSGKPHREWEKTLCWVFSFKI